MVEHLRLLEQQILAVGAVLDINHLMVLEPLAVQASLSSKSPMPIVRHSLAVLPTLYRLQATV
jgi:hypothetical protein